MVQSSKKLAMLLDFCQYEFPEQHCQPETAFDKEVLQFLRLWRKQDNFEIKTSGSTGKPKTLSHSKKHMVNSARLTGTFFQFRQGQTALLCLPIDKIGGIMMLVRAVVWKLKLYTLPPKLKLELNSLPSIDFAPLLPVQAIENFRQLANIKTILLGGAAITSRFFEMIQQHPSFFYLSYGMTETISHIAICDLQKYQNNYEVFPTITIGRNEQNCLKITSPELGILDLQTNDIVVFTSENSFQYVGRYDNIINSGGLKIMAEEIEKQLAPYISGNFYISGTPDEKLGETVTLFIEGKPWQQHKIDTLKLQIRGITPPQAIPRKILFQEKFQYTSTGKIKK